jgi:hypothetical protein
MDARSIPRPVDPVMVQQLLVEYFSLEDIRTLCFEMGVDFDDLPGEGKKGKSRELVIYCRNRAMVDKLVNKIRAARSEMPWPMEAGDDESAEKTLADSPARRLYDLVKAFNHNRHQPISNRRTRAGDDIAFRIRELAPELEGQFDLDSWLNSDNVGKRLAAVEYLDWKQDTEYFRSLLDKLFNETPFIQFHILIAINSLVDQLSYTEMKHLRERLAAYDPEGDGSRSLWSQDLQTRVEEWFKFVE